MKTDEQVRSIRAKNLGQLIAKRMRDLRVSIGEETAEFVLKGNRCLLDAKNIDLILGERGPILYPSGSVDRRLFYVGVDGTRNQFSKLTEAQVEDILLNMGHLSVTEIGEKFGVKNNLISYIRTGKAWRHVHKRIGNFNHESTLRELETWAKERGMSPGKLLFVMRTLATDLRKVLSRDIQTASRLGESWDAFEAARDKAKNAPFVEKGGS